MIAGFASHQDKARVYMMVIHYTGQTTGDDIVRAFGRTKFSVKSKTMRGNKVEMAVEVFSDGVDMPYADAIRALDGVEDLTLIQYNGEYHRLILFRRSNDADRSTLLALACGRPGWAYLVQFYVRDGVVWTCNS